MYFEMDFNEMLLRHAAPVSRRGDRFGPKLCTISARRQETERVAIKDDRKNRIKGDHILDEALEVLLRL